jgi:hypothetical protein
MTTKYFLYKANNITRIGGVVPPQPKTGHLGMACNNDWYLGCIDESELDYFQRNKEYNIQPCSSEEASGFKLLGLTTIQEGPEDEPRDLTEEELAHQKKAEILISKLSIRPVISSSIGDIDDQLADVTKGLALLERCVYAIYKACKDKGVALEEPWESLLETAVNEFDAGTLVDPIDFKPGGYVGVYETIKARRIELVTKLSPYYEKTVTVEPEKLEE